jgi:hypothetical protein
VGADRAQSAQNACEKLKNVIDNSLQVDYNKGVKERAHKMRKGNKKYGKLQNN